MIRKTLDLLYRFHFEEGGSIEYPVTIDADTLTFIAPVSNLPPFWSELDYHQCRNCPLSSEQFPQCPIAFNLSPLLKWSGSLLSYQKLRLEVITPERMVSADTTLQRALSSLLGLIMATSACPHTEHLKPMARFHLPLASDEETLYRSTSMFLLAQYFRHQSGLPSTLALDELVMRYKNLEIINQALAHRFRAASTEDATINAMVLLDILSQTMDGSLEDGLEELRALFAAYGIDVKRQ